MAHYELELPATPGLFSGMEGGPAFDVEVVEVNSGFEKRNKNQQTPRREYRISFPARLKSAYDTLLDFFEVIAQGRANSFLLKDPFDYQATATQGILTLLAGSPQTAYQMYKRRTYSGNTVDRKIQKPRTGTITIYDNGVAMGSGFSISYTTGIVTITSGTGPYTWAGEFCVPVRFDVDPMSAMLIDKGTGNQYLIEWRSIPLREVRIA